MMVYKRNLLFQGLESNGMVMEAKYLSEIGGDKKKTPQWSSDVRRLDL